ncbi:MAG: type II CAAX endopeptidase family protein [Candidatus Pacebacteria bacterium]|nr:type II CAAX endopeptidase family protein [Candidatus Paceibacterota bacterium]
MFNLSKEKELVWVQILYLFVIPTLLLYFKVIPSDLRIVMLLGITLLMYGIVRHARWSWLDLGIFKGFMKDFSVYALFTMAGVGFLFWLSAIVPHSPFLNWWRNAKFLLLFIPISVLQEVIFRGILMKLLRQAFTNPFFIIVLNAMVFALIHVIYSNATFVLPLTFIAGIGFAWIYYKYPNLILVSISHTILNFVAMVFGFFVTS